MADTMTIIAKRVGPELERHTIPTDKHIEYIKMFRAKYGEYRKDYILEAIFHQPPKYWSEEDDIAMEKENL
jgi:hypothetical protein